MKCPACDRELTEMEVGGVAVDVCDSGCGGTWFDNHELRKFDEPHEHAGEELLNVRSSLDAVVDHSKKRDCPRCDGVTMRRFFFSLKKQVEVDECARCGGMWLDSGELKRIRGLYNTEAERRDAAESYFKEVLGPKMAEMEKETEEQYQKVRRLTNMFRFICPTYYIPGDQSWGAF